MTERVLFEFPPSASDWALRGPALVTQEHQLVPPRYQLVRGVLAGGGVVLADLSRRDLHDLHEALHRELERT